jgi:hypothetical protein
MTFVEPFPTGVLLLAASVALAVGSVAATRPRYVQVKYLEFVNHWPSLKRFNPLMALQESPVYVHVIRIWGFGGLLMGTILLTLVGLHWRITGSP